MRASAGLLNAKRASSCPGALGKLNRDNTTLAIEPVVRDGKVIASRGPGAAMDVALTLIEDLVGADKRKEVEAGLVRP